jgi:hypothetical protein
MHVCNEVRLAEVMMSSKQMPETWKKMVFGNLSANAHTTMLSGRRSKVFSRGFFPVGAIKREKQGCIIFSS